MRLRLILPMLCLAVAACTPPPPPVATPRLPPDVFGMNEDNDLGAINHAVWAFAVASRTHNDPIDAARGVIAVEYLAGELQSSPRWFRVSLAAKVEMVQARDELRQVLGIRPDAPPQAVVDALLRMIDALQAGNRPAALQALSGPIFTRPPDWTLAELNDLPYVRDANMAASQAQEAVLPNLRF
jgi:hypothetical protein